MPSLSPPNRPRGPRSAPSTLAALTLAGAFGLGCESANHGKDASPTTSQRVAQVSVRLDLPSGGAPSVSVLAFRAETTDVASSDVLGAVDPLVAPAPEAACELRDVAGAARAVRDQGGEVKLQELGGVTLDPGGDTPLLPAPRVYPPLAEVVSGVIAEAGPLDLPALPESLALAIPSQGGAASLKLTLPHSLSVADGNERPLDGRAQLSTQGDLVLHVEGPPHAFLEIRPYGAPTAIACAVAASGWVVVPNDLLVKLVASAGRAPFSIEAVWRESRLVPTAGETVRVSFEARSSSVLELRP